MRIASKAELEGIFEEQGKARWAIASTNASERVAKLGRLRAAIVARQEELYAALERDFSKPRTEAWLTELYPTIEELDHTARRLRRWMRDRPAKGNYMLPLSRSYLRCEPKGRVLVMSPWNYPFQLFAAPLVSAVAAGNAVIAKPSNKTPATSAFIASLVESVFPREEVAVVEGSGSTLGEWLLELPFDHVFFTGSPKVGVRVGEAAARMHAGLTLELGGKSPALLLPGADLKAAAERLAWGKFMNAGQTCIAPDYLLCPRSEVERVSAELARAVERFYGPDEAARRASPDLARIVDEGACRRLQSLVEDAAAKGARVVVGGAFDVETRYASPTVLTGVRPDMDIMAEEIFGPILPVLAYDSLDEALTFVRERPKPLALYVFGKDRSLVDRVLDGTSSGSACVNNLILQIENLDLPFGGVGMSGTGNYHGHYGFRTFSHERNYMRQGPLNLAASFFPPYGGPMQGRMRSFLQAFTRTSKKG
jgi:aldehyde dehydrogenase (NAD+)